MFSFEFCIDKLLGASLKKWSKSEEMSNRQRMYVPVTRQDALHRLGLSLLKQLVARLTPR